MGLPGRRHEAVGVHVGRIANPSWPNPDGLVIRLTPRSRTTAMHWLLIGYMFLFIHRPFELWPALGDLHVERVYILGVMAAWAIWPGKRWVPNLQHLAYLAFATAVAFCWAMSPWADDGQVVV